MKSIDHQRPHARTRSADERQHPRLDVQLPVRFWLQPGTSQPAYKHGHTENISAGGILLRCFGFDIGSVRRLIQDQSELGLRIKLQDGGEPMAASGRILRAAESGGDMLLVLRFTRIHPDDHDRIHRFMLPHYPSLTG